MRTRDDCFELRSWTERGDGRRLNLHRLTGAGVTRDTSSTATSFEYTETGDCHAFTFLHSANDGVDQVLDGVGRLPAIGI